MPAVTADTMTLPRLSVDPASTLRTVKTVTNAPQGYEGEGFPVRRAFAGVDPISVGDIRHLVADLKKRGIGVLITDHNVRETLEIVDRAYILHDGKVLMSGSPRDVVRNENVRRVYLGDNFRIS